MTTTVLMPDAIGADSSRLPSDLEKVAGYLTGSQGIAWTQADWDRFHGVKVPIDQSISSDPLPEHKMLVLDIESGAKTIAIALAQTQSRKRLGLETTWYLSAASLAAAQAAVAGVALQAFVWYFVANWNLTEAEAAAAIRGRIVAVQFASPSSDPGLLVPGSRLTLREVNADLSVTSSSWFPSSPAPKRSLKPHPKVTAAGLSSAIATGIAAAAHAAGVKLTPAETGAIVSVAGVIAGWLR